MTLPQRRWYLYLLECQDNTIYTGIALDVMARFKQHQAGKGARYTRSHPPLHLLAVAEFGDRASAQRAEYQLKQCPAQRKREIAEELAKGSVVYL